MYRTKLSLSSGYFISFLVWFKSQDHSHDVAMDADKWRINWKKTWKKMSRNKIYTHSQGKQRQFVTSGQNVYQPTQRQGSWHRRMMVIQRSDNIFHHTSWCLLFWDNHNSAIWYSVIYLQVACHLIFFIMARYAYNHHHILLMLHNVMYTFIDVLSKHTLKMSKIEIKEKNSHIGHLFKKINDDDNHR